EVAYFFIERTSLAILALLPRLFRLRLQCKCTGVHRRCPLPRSVPLGVGTRRRGLLPILFCLSPRRRRRFFCGTRKGIQRVLIGLLGKWVLAILGMFVTTCFLCSSLVKKCGRHLAGSGFLRSFFRLSHLSL